MNTVDQQESQVREIRRGSVVLACLLALRTPGYGYGLLERLQERGIDVDANTLYPLLRRLQEQGLLLSEWDTEGARPRKYYRTSKEGDQRAEALLDAWLELADSINNLNEEFSK